MKGEIRVSHHFINPTPGEITILANSPIPHSLKPTREAYLDLIECGFNLGAETGDVNYYKNVFKLLDGLDFKYLISNGSLSTDKYAELVQTFKNDPHLGGWYLADEPAYDDLKNLKIYYDRLVNMDPDHLVYINLLGAPMEAALGPIKTYQSYLKYIESLIKPELWCYDFYPFSIKKGELRVDYDLFYSNLEMFSEISKKTSRPFWAFCQSMEFSHPAITRPAATEAYLRFEAFSALAYGAQGIEYWTYGQRYSSDQTNFISALVNLDGKKSPAWYAAKKVNSEIKKYNDVFYQCEFQEARHSGNIKYGNTKKLKGKFGPFSNIESGNQGVLATIIKNGNLNYVVIVSHDVEHNQQLKLKCAPGYSIHDLCSKFPENSITENYNIMLDKGGYVIFSYEKN